MKIKQHNTQIELRFQENNNRSLDSCLQNSEKTRNGKKLLFFNKFQQGPRSSDNTKNEDNFDFSELRIFFSKVKKKFYVQRSIQEIKEIKVHLSY